MPEEMEVVNRGAGDLLEGFKMTELGPLPEDWEVKPFQDAFVGTARVPKVKRSDYSPVGTVPVVDQGQNFIAGYVNTVKPYQCTLPVIVFGDHTRIFKFVDFSFVVGADGTKVLIPNYDRFDPLFLFYALRRLDLPSRGYNRHFHLLREIKLPFPPLPDQRAIAHVLRTVQRAKEATEKVIAAARELKKSLMRHLFTYGPVPVDAAARVPLKETEIGPLPEHWEVVRLGDVVQKTNHLDPRKMRNRVFKYVDVSSVDNQTLRIIGYQQFTGGNAPSRARKIINTRDVIFATVRPYLKRVSLVPSEFDGHLCSTAFCVLRAKIDVAIPEYLFFTVSTDQFISAVSEDQRGSSYPAVTDGDVLRKAIPLPPLPEQEEIARLLRAVDRKIQAEEGRQQALDALFKTLLHHLMTGKVRVKDLPLAESGGIA